MLRRGICTPSVNFESYQSKANKYSLDSERLKHGRVKNAKVTNLLRLATKAEVDGGSMTWKEGSIINLLDPVSVGFGRVLGDFEVDALSSETLLVCQESRAQHGKHAVQQTVDDLETRCLTGEARRKVSLVTSLSLLRLILEPGLMVSSVHLEEI